MIASVLARELLQYFRQYTYGIPKRMAMAAKSPLFAR
jgi:hypothetical protein